MRPLWMEPPAEPLGRWLPREQLGMKRPLLSSLHPLWAILPRPVAALRMCMRNSSGIALRIVAHSHYGLSTSAWIQRGDGGLEGAPRGQVKEVKF